MGNMILMKPFGSCLSSWVQNLKTTTSAIPKIWRKTKNLTIGVIWGYGSLKVISKFHYSTQHIRLPICFS